MILGLLLAVAIPVLLPVLSIVMLARLRARVRGLEALLDAQQRSIEELTKRLAQLRRDATEPRPAPAPPAAVQPTPATPPKPVTPPAVVPPPVVAPSAPVVPPPASPAPPPSAPIPPRAAPVPPPRMAPPAVAPPTVPAPSHRAPVRLDWEQLVGVKLFSAIAGVALVLAAVFFLRYSIEHGWLAPPVRAAIGLISGIALLLVCELKAARNYPATANALDAAGVAILFSTIFAAHALWQLIPGSAAFALLGMVTGVAVLLSIRRNSLFIAVLGLLGAFATPILLSTGENRPIPLFAYLLLLNIGLAWVAARKGWTILTILTLVFSALYQWGWVMRFLTASQLPLAMGIFLVFALAAFATLIFRARPAAGADRTLANASAAAAVMPLLFAAYLAAVPAYGAHTALVFGFLLMVAAGLLAVALATRDERPHLAGAAAAVLVFAIWLATSYAHLAWRTVVGFAFAFSTLYAIAPIVARRVGRPLEGAGRNAIYAAPVLLFVFAVIARVEPATADPWLLFAPMFAVFALLAWRALAEPAFAVYFVAAFFAVAAEASWSASHLTPERLGAALVLYVAFAAFSFAVPMVARRRGRPLQPSWGGGAVLVTAIFQLLFLATGSPSTTALWGLALLLAILNASVFVESASVGLPLVSLVGGALSWVVLAVWWANAAAAVGLLPSLLVLVLLMLTMLGGHAWAHKQAAAEPRPGFRRGTYLALLGHAFLYFIAIEPAWWRPVGPWPLFAATAVVTLAVSATSLAVIDGALHAAGAAAAAIVVMAWSQSAGADSGLLTVAAGESVAAYALAWVAAVRGRPVARAAAVGAAIALFVTELTLMVAAGGAVPVGVVAVAHAANLGAILALSWIFEWHWVSVAAAVPAWLAVVGWRSGHRAPEDWTSAFVLATTLYAVFTAYPFVLGSRARSSRDPYFTAIAGAVFFFFAARASLLQGGLELYVGAVPVAEGLVMALLLRDLLRMQAPESRDLGRLALVAATALGFATVAIPVQLRHQWITIGWALEGAALAWIYRRIPHRGLLYWATALLMVAFARLALNPAVFVYEPRGYRVFNWYLYTYSICAGALLVAASWLSRTEDRLAAFLPRASKLLPVGGVILLFLLLNIEIADYYATGREITFRFGVSLAQDLTYTLGWLLFGLGLLSACIYLRNRAGRIAAVTMIAVTTFKAFLYDMGSLGGLYRVVSLIGLAVSLSLVALALQKYVLQESHGKP